MCIYIKWVLWCFFKVFVGVMVGSGRGGQLEVGVNTVNSVLVRSQNEEMEKVKKKNNSPVKFIERYRKLSAP